MSTKTFVIAPHESSPKSPLELFILVASLNTAIDDSRVWKRIDYKALVNNIAVVKIVQVSYEDFIQRRDLWVCQNSLTPRLLDPATACNRTKQAEAQLQKIEGIIGAEQHSLEDKHKSRPLAEPKQAAAVSQVEADKSKVFGYQPLPLDLIGHC